MTGNIFDSHAEVATRRALDVIKSGVAAQQAAIRALREQADRVVRDVGPLVDGLIELHRQYPGDSASEDALSYWAIRVHNLLDKTP